MLKVAVGHSLDSDSAAAIQEVIQHCQQILAPHRPQAGILFAAIDHEHPVVLQAIQTAFPGLPLIGCTTDGELSSAETFQHDSLTLMLFASDEIEIQAGVGHYVSRNEVAAAQQAVESAQSRLSSPAKLCITLPESMTTSGVSILEGLRHSLGEDLAIVGGLAGDQLRFQGTYQFFQTEVLSDAVPILLFAGNLIFSHGISAGWTPVGKRGLVTKAHRNTVYEIDGAPALDFYRYYLADLEPTIEYPLAVFEPDQDSFYLRAPNYLDFESGAITSFADIPQGAVVQLTQGSREDVLSACRTSLEQALQHYPSNQPPTAALIFSCCTRGQLLGTRTVEECSSIAEQLPSDLPFCGFYTYGEIAPLEANGPARFHHKSFIVLLLGTP